MPLQNIKIKAFIQALTLAQGENINAGDIRRIAIQWRVNDDDLLMAIGSGSSIEAAKILNVDADELAEAMESNFNKELN